MDTADHDGNKDPNAVDTTGRLTVSEREKFYRDRVEAFAASEIKRKETARRKRIEGNIQRAKAAKKKKKRQRKRGR